MLHRFSFNFRVTIQSKQKVFLDSTLVDVLVAYLSLLDKRLAALPSHEHAYEISLIDGLISDLCWQIEQCRESASKRIFHLNSSTLNNFTYALAAYTDEYLITALKDRIPSSSHGAVEKMLFGTSNSGEQFFSRVKNILGKRVDREVALAAVYLMLIALGFRGKYLINDLGNDLDNYYHELSIFALAPIVSRDAQKVASAPHVSPPISASRLRPHHLYIMWATIILVICASVVYAEFVWVGATSALRQQLTGFSTKAITPKLYTRDSDQRLVDGISVTDKRSVSRTSPNVFVQENSGIGVGASALRPSPLSVDSIAGDGLSQLQIATQFLTKWANSWSRQDIDSYLACYSPLFVPEHGQSRAVWEAERRRRLKKYYSFSVTVRSISVEPHGNEIVVKFEQIYNSSRLNSISTKSITLISVADEWRISRERIISDSSYDSKSNGIPLSISSGLAK